MNLEYQIRSHEYIEAEQLKILQDKSFWLNLLCLLIFCAYGAIDLRQVSSQDLQFIEYLKQWWIGDEIPTNHLASALFYCIIAFLISSNTIPQYNFLSRWSLNRRYQQNFVQQQTQNITINSEGIKTVSESYRRFVQWQYFTYVRESKQIFLLQGRKSLNNIIIPKRVLKNSREIENLRQIFNSKIESKKGVAD